MKGLKKLLPIGVAVALLVSLLVPGAALAGTDGAVSTTLSGNDTPDVVVALSETSMTPQTEYTINVTVTDADGYADIASVVLKLYYDANTSTDETEFDTKTVADAQTLAYITWTPGGGFVLSEEASSTWATGANATPTSEDLANPFVFKITPGKVSTEADNVTPSWQIAAKVTDDQGATGWAADAQRSAMAWYGEITVNTASAPFGILAPGTTFGASSRVGSLSMTYVTNGDYDEQVKVATNAFTGGTGTVTVDVTDFDAAAADEIAFKSDDTATLGTAVGVTAAGATIDNAGTITEEAGDTQAANSLWLQISSSFTAYETKTGNIYFVIANG